VTYRVGMLASLGWVFGTPSSMKISHHLWKHILEDWRRYPQVHLLRRYCIWGWRWAGTIDPRLCSDSESCCWHLYHVGFQTWSHLLLEDTPNGWKSWGWVNYSSIVDVSPQTRQQIKQLKKRMISYCPVILSISNHTLDNHLMHAPSQMWLRNLIGILEEVPKSNDRSQKVARPAMLSCRGFHTGISGLSPPVDHDVMGFV